MLSWSFHSMANCEYNGKIYKPLETITFMEPSFYDLNYKEQKVLADGYALIFRCTPILDMDQFKSTNWKGNMLLALKSEWVALDSTWEYKMIDIIYPDSTVSLTPEFRL